jgi:hypothetical protein
MAFSTEAALFGFGIRVSAIGTVGQRPKRETGKSKFETGKSKPDCRVASFEFRFSIFESRFSNPASRSIDNRQSKIDNYSYLSATTGSTLLARRAGM